MSSTSPHFPSRAAPALQKERKEREKLVINNKEVESGDAGSASACEERMRVAMVRVTSRILTCNEDDKDDEEKERKKKRNPRVLMKRKGAAKAPAMSAPDRPSVHDAISMAS